MRWLVGWSSAAPGGGRFAQGTLQPVGAQLLWSDPDPLWAVGDWRPDEVRVIQSDGNRLAVFGCCGASDEELRLGLSAARGGAYRHLTAWPGSYTAVACVGRRLTVAADLAGARPVFHTPWDGGTAYATAALPLADLIEAQLDIGHLGALLACPDAPEALGDGTPYAGVRRVQPGHALILREGGSREITSYEPSASLVVSAPPPVDPDTAVAAVRDALVEAVRARLAAPRHASESDLGYGTNGGAYDSYDSPHDGSFDGPYGAHDGSQSAYDGASYGNGEYGNGQYGDGAYGNGAAGGGDHGASGGAPYAGGPAHANSSYSNGSHHQAAPGMDSRDPGPVPGMGPADRRAARGGPAPGVGADLSGGPASGTLALLAAGLPGMPGTVHGTLGAEAGERLLAVTFNDLATNATSAAAELERARSIAENPRLHHLVVAAG
ncbi:MAG TPA: hypothetical protein VGO89_05105, partial [Streptomyces sp.]|nr:hypothetical protein [Streptomyces sp.]